MRIITGQSTCIKYPIIIPCNFKSKVALYWHFFKLSLSCIFVTTCNASFLIIVKFSEADAGLYLKRVRRSLKMFRDQELFDKQKQEIDKLINLNKEDYIDLYLGNVAHFTLIPYLPYAWLNKENPVLVPFKTAGNLSIIGLMNLGCSFFPGRHKFILFYRGGIF